MQVVIDITKWVDNEHRQQKIVKLAIENVSRLFCRKIGTTMCAIGLNILATMASEMGGSKGFEQEKQT